MLVFVLWLNHPNITVENSVNNITVGYDLFGDSGIYLESENIGNAMLFIHHHDSKNKHTSIFCIIIEFGGLRDSDIHVYIPKGHKAKIQLSSIKK